MNWINLTKHPIQLPIGEIPPSGRIARCLRSYPTVTIVDSIELVREVYHTVTNLPPQQEGTIYIVSRHVRKALPFRSDLASPGLLIYDENGSVVAASNLIID
jgi:hypothetical protein